MKKKTEFDAWLEMSEEERKKAEYTPSLQMFTDYFGRLWDDQIKKNPMALTEIFTQKGGAIKFLEEVKKRELTQEEKDQLPDGWYRLGSDVLIQHLPNGI